MKLAIIGGRTFTDYPLLCRVMLEHYGVDKEFPNSTDYTVTEVISGAAKGADSLAARWAKQHGVALIEFPADWDKHGKAAGFIRNRDIIEAADEVLAFWTGDSKGTAHSLSLAKRQRKTTLIVYYEAPPAP
jgi:hypothetical protein